MDVFEQPCYPTLPDPSWAYHAFRHAGANNERTWDEGGVGRRFVVVETYLRGARLRGGYTCFAARTTDCNQPEVLACTSFVHSFILTLFFICQCSACLRDGGMEDGTEEINATSCCLRL